MNKVAIVYWSGTGNTEQMAQAVAEGVKNAGGEADVLTCAEFDSAKLADYGAVAFGCPAMGMDRYPNYRTAAVCRNRRSDCYHGIQRRHLY